MFKMLKKISILIIIWLGDSLFQKAPNFDKLNALTCIEIVVTPTCLSGR